LSFGSSVLLYGEKPENALFKIGVKNAEGEISRTFETPAAFVATSGGSERFFTVDGVDYPHIFDLKTGCPKVTDIASVTVTVPISVKNGGLTADYLSTLIYLSGTADIDRFLGYDFSFYAVGTDGTVYGNLVTEEYLP
jgi:thiamine biosynthesis lipoprotein ApbE